MEPHDVSDQFQELIVDSDYVQMSKFVLTKLGQFEDGRAFYEFTRKEEDIFSNAKVVKMKPVGFSLDPRLIKYVYSSLF